MLYILIILISAVGSIFLPWWIIAPISFVLCAFIAESGWKAYLISAFAIATLWIVYAIYLNSSSAELLTARIADLFAGNNVFFAKVPKALFLMIVMTLIGANVAGFAGAAGYHFRRLFK